MKVIFLQDMPKVAQAGDIKEVADGYARNFLIPKGLAAIVRPGVASTIAARQTKITTEFTELAAKLEGLEISLKARAGTQERLYGAITTTDIAAELNKTAELVVDKKKIELDKPIHQLGRYEVAIRLAKDIVPKIMVIVIEEESTKKSEGPADKPQQDTDQSV